jgi:hypothetical protein
MLSARSPRKSRTGGPHLRELRTAEIDTTLLAVPDGALRTEWERRRCRRELTSCRGAVRPGHAAEFALCLVKQAHIGLLRSWFGEVVLSQGSYSSPVAVMWAQSP